MPGFSGDPPAEGGAGGGGGGGVTQLGVSFGAGFLGGLVGGGGGLRGAAIRGALQYNALLQQLALRQQTIANKLQLAQMSLANFGPEEHPILEVTPVITPQTQKLAADIIKLQSAGKAHGAAVKAQTLARVQARNAPLASYTYVAQYGPNNGPPLPGSFY